MKRRFSCLLLAGLLGLSLAACAPRGSADPSKSQSAGADDPDTLTIAVTKDENTLAPFTYVSSTGLTVNRLVYDTLFTTDTDNNVIPWMVSDDYQVDADSSVYTFSLLPGQKFHDGTPLTAEDVAFSFRYCAGQNVAQLRKIANQIEAIEILEGDTLRFTLKESNINFLRDGLCTMRIISKAIYENEPDGTLVTESVGSGMYRLAEYKPGQYYRLEAVGDYFRGAPRVRVLQMPIIEDPSAVQQSLLSGELAAATSTVGTEVLDAFRSKPGMTVFASAGYSPVMMNINCGRAPMDQSAFREALACAVDVSGIMHTLYGDYCSVGTRGLVRSDLPYAAEGLDYTYDPGRADTLLDTLGYTEKNAVGVRLDESGAPLSFEILVYANNPLRLRMAELISQQLRQVGLDLRVKAMEMDTVDAYVWPDFEVSKGRDYDFAMWGWGSSISPDYLVNLCAGDYESGGDNVCGYRSDAFDAVVDGALREVRNMDQMEDVLRQLQEIVAEDPPLINLGYPDSLQVCNTALYGGWKSMKGGNVVNVFTFLPEH